MSSRSFFSLSNQRWSRCIPHDKLIYFILFFVICCLYSLYFLTLKRIKKKKKKKRRKDNLLVHILDQTKRTSMDRVSFLYIWTNRQIYALRPCIYLATSRRGKKIDEQEIETEGENEGEKEKKKKKKKQESEYCH